MTLRIIDNKCIDLTDSEWELYQSICKSYDANHRQGKDMFMGLFETNKEGIIIFLKPPTQKYSSMEVYMFLVGIMVHQHLGTACDAVDVLTQRMLEKEIANDERMSQKEAALDKKLSEAEAVIVKGNKLIRCLEGVERQMG